jgi:hypothetical protein
MQNLALTKKTNQVQNESVPITSEAGGAVDLERKYATLRAVSTQVNWQSDDVNKVFRLDRLSLESVGPPPPAWTSWFAALRRDPNAEAPL